LKWSTFGGETKAIADAGIQYGWRSRVVRPLCWISLVQGAFFMYGFYSLSPYLLQLLGKNYIWLTGAVFSAFSLASILGNFSIRWGVMKRRDGSPRSAPTALAVMAIGAAVLIGLIGVVGMFTARASAGVVPFFAVAALWVGVGYLFGLSGPVAGGYINQHIPSAQRATVLSLNSLFGDAGGVVGQPTLGFGAQMFGIAPTWVLGGFIMLAVAPLYRASGRAAEAEGSPTQVNIEAAPTEPDELCPEELPAIHP
jgi:MFS family permease